MKDFTKVLFDIGIENSEHKLIAGAPDSSSSKTTVII
jgi:hypothetical protein